jgi:hypothetical protein
VLTRAQMVAGPILLVMLAGLWWFAAGRPVYDALTHTAAVPGPVPVEEPRPLR